MTVWSWQYHFLTALFPLEVRVSTPCVETKYGYGGSVAILAPSGNNSCLLVFATHSTGPRKLPLGNTGTVSDASAGTAACPLRSPCPAW